MRNKCTDLAAWGLSMSFLAALNVALSGCVTTNSAPEVQEEEAKLSFQAGPGPYSFECDAPGGRYDELNVSTSGGNLHVAGMMRFLTLRSHPDWAASATVTFAGPTRKSPFMGLQAVIMPDRPDTIQFAYTGHGGPQDRTVFATTPMSNAWIPFEVDLSKAGDLTVSIAGQAEHVHVGAFEPARLSLFCSTAIVRFSNVTVENAH